jgi:short-subunit dehydrogenase
MSLIALCNAFLPQLKKSQGRIVNISSICGLLGITYRTSYAASKFAVTGFSKALRAELNPHNVSVSVIYPGYICTNISKNAQNGSGNKLGVTDSNIANGIPVDIAVGNIFKSIYLR